MDTFNHLICTLFDLICFPFASLHPLWGLMAISVLTGIMMLFIFRFTSDQRGIREVKNRIKAHIFELRLFKDDLGLMLEAQKNILKHNVSYMKYSLKPMLFLIVPIVLIMIQLSLWFDRHPLHIGESAIVKVKFKDHPPLSPFIKGEQGGFLDENITLKIPEGVALETPPLRIPEEKEIDWRIKALSPGKYNLEIQLNPDKLTKSLIVGDNLARLSVRRVPAVFLQQLIYPAEKSFSAASGIEYIEVTYPPISYIIWDWQIHWLVIFFVVSVVTGFMLKRFFRVEL